jgi:hypothetical protein
MHKEKWLELARALGRELADKDWERNNPDYKARADHPFQSARSEAKTFKGFRLGHPQNHGDR